MTIRMPFRFVLPILPFVTLAAAGCLGNSDPVDAAPDAASLGLSASVAAGVRVVAFPSEDPGPPLYARVTPLMNQIFSDDGYVAIPFYRDPDCVPADTDLFVHLHPPGPTGPGAFGCTLLVEGAYTIEADATLGTFPLRVVARGPAQVWFISTADFAAVTGDGDFTMAELLALDPLRGTASTFHEMLAPRLENHHIVITSRGMLEDGRTFQFNVNHWRDVTRSIVIRFGAEHAISTSMRL